jgi:transcription elongation GreA/GreB family factor
VRRPTVVSVWIPLRRATALGLLFSVPAYFIHEEMGTINELTQLPEWAWVLVASVLIFAISRLHEYATELVDRLLDRNFHHAKQQLAAVGRTIQHADSLAEIERLLVEEPVRTLGLASAALFREEDGVFRRRAVKGWEAASAETLSPTGRVLAGKLHGGAFALDGIGGIDPVDPRFPSDLARPVLGVPVSNPRRCFAVVLYGGHMAGTDLDGDERDLLTKLARDAEIAYASVDRDALQKRIKLLEGQLAHVSAQR